ncbi:MAG: hypothetical protein LUF26_06665 [Firmicutes bacterium]|nr:hypothetical protein [Bacillota bacterium]
MTRFLYNLILMSISGSVMYLLALAVRRATKGRFSGWYYAFSVTAVLLLIIPLQAVFTVPKIINIEVSQSIARSVESGESTAAGTGISAVIFLIWLAVTAALIFVMTARYIRTARSLKAVSEETYDEKILSAYSETRRLLNVPRDIKIMTSDALSSPLLFGIFKPAIVIPSRDFTYDELKMIFAHELTHYRHKDLIIKLIAMIAASVHWFNPLSHFLTKSVNECCELCCDESVLKKLNLPDKKCYGRLIISVIEHTPSKRFAYTTAMASPKRGVQRRLLRIAEFKKLPRAFKALGAMAAVSMAVCSVTAFGFSEAKEIMPEPIAEFIDEAVTAEAAVPAATQTPEETAPPAEHTVTETQSAPAYTEEYSVQSEQSGEVSATYTAPTYDTADSSDAETEYAEYADESLSDASLTDDAEQTEPSGAVLETGASREDSHAVLGTPASVDSSKETYTLENGDTAVIKYDGDIIYDMYIVQSTE